MNLSDFWQPSSFKSTTIVTALTVNGCEWNELKLRLKKKTENTFNDDKEQWGGERDRVSTVRSQTTRKQQVNKSSVVHIIKNQTYKASDKAVLSSKVKTTKRHLTSVLQQIIWLSVI